MATSPDLAVSLSISQCFNAAATLRGSRLAVVDQTTAWSYAELSSKVNRIAREVIGRCGAGSEPVGLLFGHEAIAVAAIYAVLRANKAYVALDPYAPSNRNCALLDTLKCRLILTDARHQAQAQGVAGSSQSVLDVTTIISQPSGDLPDSMPGSETPAAIHFTSGSTGMQKGIVRTHADVLRRVQLDDQSFDYRQEDVFTHLYGCSSAGSMTDIFGSLLSGATLCVYDVRQAGLDLMAPWLNLNQVTLLHLNSTLLRKFLDQLPAGAHFPELRLVRPSQQLLANDVRRLWQVLPQSAKVIHQYASTETGPVASLTIDRQTMLSDEIVPVGRPLPGVEIRLLDDQDRSVSMGDVGEIAIRSPYLASEGSALAASRRDDGDEGFYRTGDLGRIRPDGLLELVGRTDSLVKIRGFRVSLSAIEAALRRLDLVDEAVVAAHPDPNGDRTPVAFVVPATDAQGLASELRRRLREQLPPYALPARFVFLDRLPRLSNGKVDYGALPGVDTARRFLDTPYAAPRTPVETGVAAIWAEVLGLDRVGIHDSFLDLGGHSLLAARLVSRVVRQFQVDLPLSLLFESPTVADMALAITQHQAARLDQDMLERLLAELEEEPVVPTIEPGP